MAYRSDLRILGAGVDHLLDRDGVEALAQTLITFKLIRIGTLLPSKVVVLAELGHLLGDRAQFGRRSAQLTMPLLQALVVHQKLAEPTQAAALPQRRFLVSQRIKFGAQVILLDRGGERIYGGLAEIKSIGRRVWHRIQIRKLTDRLALSREELRDLGQRLFDAASLKTLEVVLLTGF